MPAKTLCGEGRTSTQQNLGCSSHESNPWDYIYRFSEWKDCDGTMYPSKCVMFRRKSGVPWFFHEILELERLKELPEDLKR